MNKKVLIMVGVALTMAIVGVFIIMLRGNGGKASPMQDTFFLGSQHGETNIYHYNAEENNTETVGNVDKQLANAVLKRDKNELIAVIKIENRDEGVFSYDINKGEGKTLVSREEMDEINEREYKEVHIFPTGNKVAILCYDYEDAQVEVFLYDIETGHYSEVLKGEGIRYIQCLDQKEILYVEEGKLKIYDIDTKSSQVLIEKFAYGKEITVFELSNNREKLAVMKMGNNGRTDTQRLYLYDIEDKTYKKILSVPWNTYFGYDFAWSLDDEYIYYSSDFAGLFSSFKPTWLAYNLNTKRNTKLLGINEMGRQGFLPIREEK